MPGVAETTGQMHGRRTSEPPALGLGGQGVARIPEGPVMERSSWLTMVLGAQSILPLRATRDQVPWPGQALN